MIEPLVYENCLKIGFLNNKDVYDITNYEQIYDALIVGDGDFSFINLVLDYVTGTGENLEKFLFNKDS